MGADWVIRTIQYVAPIAFSESNMLLFLCLHLIFLLGYFGWGVTKIFEYPNENYSPRILYLP